MPTPGERHPGRGDGRCGGLRWDVPMGLEEEPGGRTAGAWRAGGMDLEESPGAARCSKRCPRLSEVLGGQCHSPRRSGVVRFKETLSLDAGKPPDSLSSLIPDRGPEQVG